MPAHMDYHHFLPDSTRRDSRALRQKFSFAGKCFINLCNFVVNDVEYIRALENVLSYSTTTSFSYLHTLLCPLLTNSLCPSHFKKNNYLQFFVFNFVVLSLTKIIYLALRLIELHVLPSYALYFNNLDIQ